MSTILEPVTEIQDRIIDAISSLKQPVSKAVGKAVDFVVERRSDLPSLPFAAKLPTPGEVIDNQAKFATKFVSTSKTVANAAAKAAAPLTDQLLDRTGGTKATVAAA